MSRPWPPTFKSFVCFVPRFNGVMAACSKVGRWQFSLHFLDAMSAARPSPSQFSYGTALDACSCHTDLWHKALAMLREVSQAPFMEKLCGKRKVF